MFVDIIQVDCLRNLKEFGIAHFGHYKKVTEQYWFRVFDTFTSTLSSVEQLQLNTPLHLEWCQYFARMSNLKILNWQGMINPDCGFGRTGNPERKIVNELDATFVNFIEKPQFTVDRRLI